MDFEINTFAAALCRVLGSMSGVDVVSGASDSFEGQVITSDISAHIPLKRVSQAQLVLTLSEAGGIELVKAISGLDVDFENPLLTDSIGEILNMVAGQAQREGRYEFGLPLVAKGRQHEVTILRAGQSQRILSKFRDFEIGLYLMRPDGNNPGESPSLSRRER